MKLYIFLFILYNISCNIYNIIKDFMENVYDLIVIGGGPAGIGAAFTAAEQKMRVAIIERHSILGGNWTNGYVLSILGVYTYSGKTKIVGGIADKVIERLKHANGTNGKVGNFIPFRPDEMKIALEQMALDLNIDLFYNSLVTGVETVGTAIKGLKITGKNRTKLIYGKAFIDSSGDADIAYLLSLNTFMGNDKGVHQEATIPFRIGNVNEDKVIEFSKTNPTKIATVISDGRLSRIRILPELVEKAKNEHMLYLPHANAEFLFNTSRAGEFVCNATHVNVADFSNGNEIAKISSDARMQILSSLNFLVKEIPGFENSYLIDSGSFIGLRETRRATGEYVLTKNDVLNNARFDDVIARCGHPIEVHDPDKGVYYIHLNGGDDSWYEIPYRAIVVKGITNLFAIGRCISSEFEAQASVRVTGTAMSMGQAAAFASMLMIKNNIQAKEVSIKELQALLKAYGAII